MSRTLPTATSAAPLVVPATARVALVHDWLTGMRGGERVLEHLCALFPKADLHTLLYRPERMSPAIRNMRVIESSFARLPRAMDNYRYYLRAMPHFINRIPSDNYDLVISTSHCVAKGTRRPRRGMHLSYVFSPMRYVWDHFEDYLGESRWKNLGLAALRGPMQRWDRASCREVDSFAADSAHIARKIGEFWGREARVIYPPVELDRFQPADSPPEDFFLVVSALVPYKKIDRAIEAANEAEVPLVVIGSGPEEARLRRLAGPTVRFMGHVPDSQLAEWYRRARALFFPGIEDFGITALEAMACGRPVLALRGGGVAETVVEGQTGAFFEEPTAKSLARLLSGYHHETYKTETIRARAEQFSPEGFRSALTAWINHETRFLW